MDTKTQVDKDVEAILARLPAGNLTDSALLDETVHDAASAIGSSTNNEGLEAQVRFLVEQWGKEAGYPEKGVDGLWISILREKLS